MNEKITLDLLTEDSVSVKKEYVQEKDGVKQVIGEPWRRAYSNTLNGREKVQNELPEIYKNAIFSVWGTLQR